MTTVEGRIAGYYTLSALSVDATQFPREIVRKLAKYPLLPVTLLGRLAVDRRFQGQGLGERLLADALRRRLRNSETVASMAVVVDAKDEAARSFYLRHEFVPFPSTPQRLFLPMATVAKMFE